MPVPPLPHPAFNLKFAIYLRLPTSPKVLNPQLPPSRPASSQMLVLISCPWQEKYFKITYITDGWSLHPFQDIYLLSCSKENFKQPLLSALKKREEHWGRGAGPGEFTPSPARPDGPHSCFSFYSRVFWAGKVGGLVLVFVFPHTTAGVGGRDGVWGGACRAGRGATCPRLY